MKSTTRAVSIPKSVKDAVKHRDGDFCILCGRPGDPVAHVVRRSQMGMGVEDNIVTLCPRCHYAYDEGLYKQEMAAIGFRSRLEIKAYIYHYMRRHYPGWTPESVKYRKWEELC